MRLNDDPDDPRIWIDYGPPRWLAVVEIVLVIAVSAAWTYVLVVVVPA